MKAKLRDANNQNYEATNKLGEMNRKIHDFNRDWYKYKQSSFGTIIRSIVDAFYETVYQYKDIFKEIMIYNMPEKPPLKSKKSITLETPLLLEKANSAMYRSSVKKPLNYEENSSNFPDKEERKSKVSFNEKQEDAKQNVASAKILNRRSTNFFFENNQNYIQFNIYLKNLNMNLEDEHLQDLEENEIVFIFKQISIEMTKKYEEYKIQLSDCLKYYKEIKEVYLQDLIDCKEIYVNSLGDFLHTKFNKTFQKKTGNYLGLFEIVVIRMRTYSENIKNYLDVKQFFKYIFL